MKSSSANRFFIFLLIFFIFSFCSHEKGNDKSIKELARLRQFEKEKLLKEVKDCKTNLEKDLCLKNWYRTTTSTSGFVPDTSIFNNDTTILSHRKKEFDFFLKFECNGNIYITDGLTNKTSWWKLKNDILEIFLEYEDFGDSYHYKIKRHAGFKIIQIDSLLMLKKVKEIINSSEMTFFIR